MNSPLRHSHAILLWSINIFWLYTSSNGELIQRYVFILPLLRHLLVPTVFKYADFIEKLDLVGRSVVSKREVRYRITTEERMPHRSLETRHVFYVYVHMCTVLKIEVFRFRFKKSLLKTRICLIQNMKRLKMWPLCVTVFSSKLHIPNFKFPSQTAKNAFLAHSWSLRPLIQACWSACGI